ncbi:MAG: CDP-diacylglycerol--glycerol-3-phosphate 3-phosphatidyltransferase [Candidatus Schekmanbacteria bacterium]|nr:MAG: CDP-diacylglycerol--glycerol-3-phosphate 3-phosphatidyltransferase [Candidatus Schekmanbacteria bacterium]
MNIANWITVFRILLVPFFIIFLLYGRFKESLWLFCIAGITDGIDGYIARSWGLKTELGSYLDPLADKLLLVSSFIVFSLKFPDLIPPWLTVLVISKDLIIVIGVIILHFLINEPKIQPSFIGKCTTAVQILLIFCSLLSKTSESSLLLSTIDVTVYVAAFLTVAAGMQYVFYGTAQLNGN